jgi:hypothetical protein
MYAEATHTPTQAFPFYPQLWCRGNDEVFLGEEPNQLQRIGF